MRKPKNNVTNSVSANKYFIILSYSPIIGDVLQKNMFKFFKKKTPVYKSPNFGERKGGCGVEYLVLHYTGMKSARDALERLCDPAAEVSAHYVIEQGGQTHHLVDDDKRAWHAGLSCWAGQRDMNSVSIGVEIVNRGHEFGYHEFPDVQVERVISLCRDLMGRYNIPASHILAHSDIAPSRKLDPGELFPWERLARENVGLWPSPSEHDYQAAEDVMLDETRQRELLHSFGYDPDVPLCDILAAFHRRYYPEKFEQGADPAVPDLRSFAMLLSLIAQAAEA